MSKRVLWVGDAVISSGFALCTHAVCDQLHEDGWGVHVLGINYFGDPHPFPYNIYPCYQPLQGGRDYFGVFRLSKMIARINPDVVVFLNDPWNIPNYIAVMRDHAKRFGYVPPTVGWLAVDAKNQPKDSIEGLTRAVVWTDFAKEELRNTGFGAPIDIVPLGVDHDIFYPHDKAESRDRIAVDGQPMSQDEFVIGVVGRNQPRKRLDLSIQALHDIVHDYGIDNARMFMHVGPTGDTGFDLNRLADYYDVTSHLTISEGDLGTGIDQNFLPVLYSAMDVYLTTTQGEGWGLPCLEAMACGVPALVPEWSGLGDWTGDAALKVPCTSTAVTAPLDSLAYTIGGIPDRTMMAGYLASLARNEDLRDQYSEKALERANDFSWNQTAEDMVAVIEEVVA